MRLCASGLRCIYNYEGLSDQEVPDYICHKLELVGGSLSILEGGAIRVIDIEIGRSDSVMTVMGNMIKFNKATATELMYPEYVRMLIDAANKQVVVQTSSEKTRNAVVFSKGEDKRVYAITVKVPAIVVAIRKLIPELGENESLTFRGNLYAEDKAIIYDLSSGEPVKRRKRRSVEEAEAESDAETDSETKEAEFEEAAAEPVASRKRGRKKKEQ